MGLPGVTALYDFVYVSAVFHLPMPNPERSGLAEPRLR